MILESPAREGGGGVRQGKEGSRCKSLWVMGACYCRGPAERAWSASRGCPTERGGEFGSIPPANPPTLWVKRLLCVWRGVEHAPKSLDRGYCSGAPIQKAGEVGNRLSTTLSGASLLMGLGGWGQGMSRICPLLYCLLLNPLHLHEEA